MIKTIEELTAEAEWQQLAYNILVQEEDDHRRAMLRAAAEKAIVRQALDAALTALIAAGGEPS